MFREEIVGEFHLVFLSLLVCSVDSLREFITQFLAGEVEPYIKSEPLPEDNSGPVTVSHAHQPWVV